MLDADIPKKNTHILNQWYVKHQVSQLFLSKVEATAVYWTLLAAETVAVFLIVSTCLECNFLAQIVMVTWIQDR